MTTFVPEATAEISAADTPVRSHRGRWLLLGLIGPLVVAIVVAGSWLASYQPLRSGQIGGVQAATVEHVDNFFGSEYRVVAPEPGDTISMWIELRNNGPIGITVVRVGQPFNPDGVVDPATSAESTTAGRLELTVFPSGEQIDVSSPFAIAPDTSYEARLSFDILDCATLPGHGGSLSTVTTVPVTYRVLGITRTVDLEIGYAISIESEPRCPAP